MRLTGSFHFQRLVPEKWCRYRGFSIGFAGIFVGFSCVFTARRKGFLTTQAAVHPFQKLDKDVGVNETNSTPSPIEHASTSRREQNCVMEDSYSQPTIVIVGGGYTGSKLAQGLEHIFRVVFIDEKNYVESIEYVLPVLLKPWDRIKSPQQLADCQAVHRNYLQYARVVVGTVTDVNMEDKYVLLNDGRRVSYHLMAWTVGEGRAFPFHTHSARNLLQREKEIESFSGFIERDCHRIAVVGGGPMGVSVASLLGHNYPFKTIDLFHRQEDLLNKLPDPAGALAEAELSKLRNVQIYKACTVTSCVKNTQRNWWGRILRPTFDITYSIHHHRQIVPTSVPHQLYFGEFNMREAKKQPLKVKESGLTLRGYDYVFVCSGSVPGARQFVSTDTNLSLLPHLDNDGRFRVSRFMQLLGHPEVFAVGRCNSFPGYVRGLRTSDYQANLFMRNLCSTFLSATFNRKGQPVIPSFTPPPHALRDNVVKPHLKIPLGGGTAIAMDCIAGLSSGPDALSSWDSELKDKFMRHVLTPKLPPPPTPGQIKSTSQAVKAWLQMAVTDVADFIWI